MIYIQQKYLLSEVAVSRIDWTSHAQAIRNFQTTSNIFMVKFLSKWLPVENKSTVTTPQDITVSAHHVLSPSKILTMHFVAQTLAGVGGDLILDKHYYGIRTAQIQTRHWWIF
jgi:hypothetical protein